MFARQGNGARPTNSNRQTGRRRPRPPQRGTSLELEILENRCLLTTTAAAYAALPLPFEPNVGQAAAGVQYLAHGGGYGIFLSGDQAVLSLLSSSATGGTASNFVTVTLVGANPAPQGQALAQLPGVANYLDGNNPADWHTNIPTYADVQYANVYSGIDLVYHGVSGQLEYDFTVAPGANPGVIRLSVSGASSIQLDARGDLVLATPGGNVVEEAPVVYQEINGVRQSVAGKFVLEADGDIGFAVGSYDASVPLVIDPVLSYSTYLGGSGNDTAAGIAIDSAGDAYITGTTSSTDFPTQSSYQGTAHGNSDAFVSKLNAAGTALVYSTYLGGSAFDAGNGIAVDSAGDAYIVGSTQSTDFPTVNAYQTFGGSPQNAFLAKLNPAGNVLLYSSYLGEEEGPDSSSGAGVAVNNQGDAYITGATASSFFPVTAGAFQGSYNGGQEDAFVAEFDTNASGVNSLVYSTYLGGSNDDAANAIAIDSAGDAFVTGMTRSSDFPLAGNSYQSTNGGFYDVFVSELNPTGSTLLYSTYLGGNDLDIGFGIAVDSAGDIYVTGDTVSSNFPTVNAFEPTFTGSDSEAFVAEFAPAAGKGSSSLVFSTLLGGTGPDNIGYGIAIGANHDIYVTGLTDSTDFPTANAIQPQLDTSAGVGDGGYNDDAFVTVLNSTASGLIYSTYLGGAQDDGGTGIAVDNAGDVYIAGYTSSSDFPTANAFQPRYPAGAISNAFVAEIAVAAPTITSLSPSTADEGAPGFTLTVNGRGFVDGSTVEWNGQALQTTFVSTGVLQAVVPASLVAEEGNASITVFNSVPGEGSSNAVTFTILDAPLTNTTPVKTLTSVEGHNTGLQVVATFADDNPNAPVSDFTNTTINWGDGTTSLAIIGLVSRGVTAAFEVVGSHVYAEEGTYTVTVQVHDVGGQSVTSTNTKFSVGDAALVDETPVTTKSAVQNSTTGYVILATFLDTNPQAPLSDFNHTTTINWGDGTTTAGIVEVVSASASGTTFQVVGLHTYASAGDFTVLTNIADVGGSTLTSGRTTIDVTPVPSPGQMSVVLGGSGYMIFVVTSNQALYVHNDATGWTQIGGSGTVLAVSAAPESNGDTVAFVVTTGHGLARYDLNSGWSALGGPGTIESISAGRDAGGLGDVFVLTSGNSFTEYSGSAGWRTSPLGAPGTILSMSAVTGGRVYVVTSAHQVESFDDTNGWVSRSPTGFASSIDTVDDGLGNVTLFAVGLDQSLFEQAAGSNNWTQLGGSGTIEFVSGGQDSSGKADVFAITTSSTLAEYTSAGGWSTIGGPGTVLTVSAVNNGRVYAIGTDGSVLGHDDTFGWFPLAGPGFAET